MLSQLLELLKCLPELLRLYLAIAKRNSENAAVRKTQDDIKTIHEAFLEQNPEKLRDIFRST